MHRSPAITRLCLTISAAPMSVCISSARAADCANAPPEPMAMIPCSGSSTSPLPVITRLASRSATASIASSRRSTRSVRQSLVSSIAERTRWPWCFSSLASKRSNSVKASAVAPAKPASTWSRCRRRTLRALALKTRLPSVTWPSPPSATCQPVGVWRRTLTMVVPWKVSIAVQKSVLMRERMGDFRRERAELVSSSAPVRRATQAQDRQAQQKSALALSRAGPSPGRAR